MNSRRAQVFGRNTDKDHISDEAQRVRGFMKQRITKKNPDLMKITQAFKRKFECSKVSKIFMETDKDGNQYYTADCQNYRAHDGDYERLGIKKITVGEI